jgi:LmbE family N-acetylglucosaminyl deacetylase
MISLFFRKRDISPLKVLCLGAHSDDIEIGCGGTIMRLLTEDNNMEVTWVVFSAGKDRSKEARSGAELFLRQAEYKEIIINDFKDSFFPYMGSGIKQTFEELKKSMSPDLIFTHYQKDAHQDHKLISELTWNTFRNHLILEYEIVKYDGDLGSPNVFITLSAEIAQKKIKFITESFESQGSHHWFTEDAFLSIMRIRGLECNAAERFAEGYYCRKVLI